MPPSYRKLQFYAIAISIASVIYNGAEGAVSIGFGAESSSRSLVFFGIQSGIEVASALIVLWRFRNVAKPGEERQAKLDAKNLRFEKVATLTIGALLILLGLSTVATAISVLVLRQEPEANNVSLIISATALVLMILIWLPKRYLARELNSSAMEGEATCSLSCIQITIVLFVGSLIYRVWHGGWWLDGATSIVLGLLFGWEGVKMIRWAWNPDFDGGCCQSCRVPDTERAAKTEESRSEVDKCCEEKDECCCSGEEKEKECTSTVEVPAASARTSDETGGSAPRASVRLCCEGCKSTGNL